MVKAPSIEAINIVLAQAANAPLQNLNHAAAVDKALGEVRDFLADLHNPVAPSDKRTKPADAADAADAAGREASRDHDPADLPASGSPLKDGPAYDPSNLPA